MKFVKYSSNGNDFIITPLMQKLSKEQIIKLCDRHFGIGADGLIIPEINPFKMNFYNQDGSLGTMCGNGIRAVASYFKDFQNAPDVFSIETLAGPIKIRIENDQIICSMMNYSFDLNLLDTSLRKNFNEVVKYARRDFMTYSVFIGTKHLVLFINDFNLDYYKALGEHLCNHYQFKSGINVDFVTILDENQVFIRTYERGVGMTLSCGTGACATFAVMKKLNLVSDELEVISDGGKLKVKLEENNLFLIGKTKKVFEGETCN